MTRYGRAGRRDGMVLVPEGQRMFAPLTAEENLVLSGYTATRERSRECSSRSTACLRSSATVVVARQACSPVVSSRCSPLGGP